MLQVIMDAWFVIFVLFVFLGLLGASLAFGASLDKTGARETIPLSRTQKQIGSQFHSLVPKKKRSFNSICFPKSFELSSPQKFIGAYLGPSGKGKELIAFHGIGSGKTCAAIQAVLAWLKSGSRAGPPMIVAPASLIPGFRAELRGPCARNLFTTESDRKILSDVSHADYSRTLARVDAAIDKQIIITSYNKFLSFLRGQEKIRGKTANSLEVPLLIVDEAHNFCNLTGSYNRTARQFIESHPRMKILLMTATPVYDKPEDLIGLFALARRQLTAQDLNDPEKLSVVSQGLISYYAGAPPSTYPETKIKYSVSYMSSFQTRWYLSQVEKEIRANGKLSNREVSDSFYCASRAKAIAVFPDGVGGKTGLAGMKKQHLTGEPLAKYSSKLYQLIRRLKSGKLSFIYSNFAGPNGVQFITKALRANGYKDYRESGSGKSFAVFSGEETAKEKGRIREIFNSRDNDTGKKIQVVVGSPAIKEGVSFFRIRQVHILDPYWNYSRIEQVYGRASRYCSHKSLPADKRKVSVFIYVSATKRSKGMSFRALVAAKDPKVSVDALILGMAENKQEQSKKILETLVGSAVDRQLKYSSKD